MIGAPTSSRTLPENNDGDSRADRTGSESFVSPPN